MKANFNITAGLLGDACLCEPALHAYGLKHGGVSVFIKNEAVRPLYEHHPTIRLVREPGLIDLDESRAFGLAVSNRRYFAEGYWPQVGLPFPEADERRHFRVHLPPSPPTNAIVLCPFSRSCSGHQGQRPNKTVPVLWWEEVIERVRPHSPSWISLGGSPDPWVMGATDFRQTDLLLSAKLILNCRLLITVETWANVVAADKSSTGQGRTLFMGSATPDWFIQPPGSESVWAPHPDEWSMNETVEKIRKLLAETY